MAETNTVLYRVVPSPRPSADCHNWCSILDEAGKTRIVICFSRGTIEAKRFDAYLAECHEHDDDLIAAIGCSVGIATATSPQRKKVSAVLKGKRLAIVANNVMTRGLVTALNWLGLKIKSFDWEQLDDLVEYLAVAEIPAAVIIAAIFELRERSGAAPAHGSASDE